MFSEEKNYCHKNIIFVDVFYYLPLACGAGDYEIPLVCEYVRGCQHACVIQFPLKWRAIGSSA